MRHGRNSSFILERPAPVDRRRRSPLHFQIPRFSQWRNISLSWGKALIYFECRRPSTCQVPQSWRLSKCGPGHYMFSSLA